MKYFITYAAMDRKLGANPFWHSVLLFSQWPLTGGKVQVIDNYGFYGLPSTDSPESCLGHLKRKCKLDTDFQGNHGWLQHEQCRYLDRGYGLHGVTFELDETAFFLLHARCQQQCIDQQQAVDEAVLQLNLGVGKKSGEYRIHPYEHHSAIIFEFERKKSEEQQRPARLSPFDFSLSVGLGGPSVAKSHTCKSHII